MKKSKLLVPKWVFELVLLAFVVAILLAIFLPVHSYSGPMRTHH